MNKHYPNTDFEALRVPQLEKIYNGINHSVEELQGKMNRDMGRSLSKYDIHPRNYNIIPEIEKCSLHDLELLEELTESGIEEIYLVIGKNDEECYNQLFSEVSPRIFNKLDDEERRYLYYKFFDPNNPTDEQIIQNFNRYDYGFRALKREAYIKFAIIMCIEVYD